MGEKYTQGLNRLLNGCLLVVAILSLAVSAEANVASYLLTDGTNGNTATTSVAAADPPANNTTTVAGAATYASINNDDGTMQFLDGGNNQREAVQLVLTIAEDPATITSINVKFSGYATTAGPLNLYLWNGTTWVSIGSMALATADTTPAAVNYATGPFTNYVIGGKLYVQYVLPATGNPDLYVDYVAVDVNFTPPAYSNPLLHNSLSTASTKWPIAESGKTVAGWGIPNAQYGEFTCGTCHARNTANIKRVKTAITAPTDTFPGSAVNFQSTSGANSFGDDGRAVKTSSNLVCGVCHSKTAVHRYDSSGISDFNHKNANQTDCIACHPHKQGFKPMACDSCHGYPPTVGIAQAGDGLAVSPFTTGSALAGAHQKHVVTLIYACENCHNGYVMPKESLAKPGFGDISISFSNFGVTTGSYTGQNNVSYNGTLVVSPNGTKTCNSVYCHSPGQSSTGGALGGGDYAAPAWDGAAACGSCHKVTEAAGLTSGSHAAHLGSTGVNGCGDCHTGAANDASTYASAAHVNHNIEVANSYSQGASHAPANGYGTCTASCHNTGRNSGGLTDVWGTTLNNCSECHPTVPATAGHTTHMGKNFKGVAIACGDCHTGTTQGTTAGAGHRDGNIDAVGYATANKALGSAFTTCNAASCHQDGLVSNTHYINTPAWDADTANCTQCHAAVPATGSHAAHVTTAGKDCSACHAGATKDTAYDSTAHGDLNIDVAVGGYAANKAIASPYTGCNNLACHSDGMTATGNAPTWGTDANCAACHLSNMTTGSHSKHLADSNNCGNCHDGAVKDSNPGTAHVDGNVDVTATYTTANAAYGSASWTTCSAASCHDDGRAPNVSPQWGTTPVNSCLACHETIPSTGSHASHVADATTECTDCHAGAVEGTTAPTAGHRDGNIDVDAGGYPTNRAKTSAFTNCTSASCHNTGRNSGGLTDVWGTTLNNCSECHPTVPATAGHAKHVTTQVISAAIACGTCHSGTTQGTTAGAGHRDGNIDVASGGYPTDRILGSAYANCTTAYCHSNGKGTFQTVAWNATSTGCTFCHGNPPAGTHSAGDTDCSSCHTHVNADDISFSVANRALHIDGTVQASADDCLTCHGTGKSRDPESSDPDHKAHTSMATVLAGKKLSSSDFGNAAWWYSVSYDASSKPLMGCGQCHPADVSVHRNTFVETKLTSVGEAGIPATNAKRNNGAAAAFSTGTGKCSAVYCHGDGVNDGTYPDSPVWNAVAFDAGMTCASCHGNSPATNAHNLHAVGIHYDTLYDDDAYGLMATAPTGKAASAGADAAHGNSTSSDTIGCQSCHNNTVTVEYNAGNSVCGSCHSDTNAPATGNELAVIKASSSSHLDGASTVAFATLSGFKSKAQVRNDMTTVSELNVSWTRTNGYKAAAGTSYDAGKAVVPGWNSGTKSCSTVDCHNGIATPAWNSGSSGNCMSCHTSLPQ